MCIGYRGQTKSGELHSSGQRERGKCTYKVSQKRGWTVDIQGRGSSTAKAWGYETGW